MSKPLVSVLISAYNHEAYVQETIRSIINQTYENIELIIIDDGSKDKTSEKIEDLLDECSKRFQRVVFQKQENAGTCISLNRLIALAQGKFAYLIASDDLAKPTAIEKFENFLENHEEYVLAVGDNEIIDASSQRIGWGGVGNDDRNSCALHEAVYKTFGSYLKTESRMKKAESLYGELLRNNFIPNGYLVKFEALRTITFTPEAPLEDLFLHLSLSKLGKYAFINEILFSYRWHNNNTIKQTSKMVEFYKKTILYEEKLVNSMKDKYFAEIFYNVLYQQKTFFHIGNFIKLKKYRTPFLKQTVLTLFNQDFILKSKDLLA